MDDLQNQDRWQMARLSSTDEMTFVIDSVVGDLADLGYAQKDIFGVRLVMEETIVNSIKHAHKYDPSKEVKVRYKIAREHFLAEVEDQGAGFDPSQILDPTADENLERPCGRGLLLIRHYTNWVRFNERGNCVTFCKCSSKSLAA